MEHVLEVEQRTETGKGYARKLRARGLVPGVLYGHKEAPLSLAVSPRELERHFRKSGVGLNTLFSVKGLERECLALLKDTQIDPVSRSLLHVDLFEVRDGDRLVIEVPFEFTGRPAGVTLGGTLQVVRRQIRLDVSPLAIPAKVTVDVGPLEIGDNLHISDLPLPEGTQSADDLKLAVCSVKAPRTEATAETEEEGEAAEVAEPEAS